MCLSPCREDIQFLDVQMVTLGLGSEWGRLREAMMGRGEAALRFRERLAAAMDCDAEVTAVAEEYIAGLGGYAVDVMEVAAHRVRSEWVHTGRSGGGRRGGR